MTDIEKRLIEAEYERRINGNRTKEDKLVDDLVADYPNYYQLRIYSGGIKNALQNIKGSKKDGKKH